MGMSTHVKAYIGDTDLTYLKHKKVLLACIEADIKKLPQETAEYFGSEYPDEYLLEEKLEVNVPIHKYNDGDMCEGYEIFIEDIPEGTKVIRFKNCW